MGAFLEKPDTAKFNEHGSGNGLRFGVASMQGWRVEMEDAHCVQLGLDGELSDWSYFAVFDGHAGAFVSAHCAENLLECILQTDEFQSGEDVESAIRSGFLRLDERMRELPELSSHEDKSGSTAVCAFVSPRHIYIANCGDSRAVLARDGTPTLATCDHKPELPGEKQRIYRAGGSVMIQRVNGSLAVSRALGDYEYKNRQNLGPCEQLVSPEPEVYCRERDDRDEFLVLACDGVWDVMTNEALCSYIHSRLRLTDDLEAIANQVIDTCLYKGSRDNMSIVLVVFPGAPSPSADAQRAEQQLDDTLRRKLTALVSRGDEAPTFPQALQLLTEEDLPGLPPGGGIASKRGVLEKIYLELCPDNAYTINSADMSL